MLPSTACIALLISLQATPRPFTPALDFRERNVAGWVAELDRSDGRPHDAAWSLYHHDDRSPEVVDALRRALATPDGAQAHVAIDTVLAHWGVPFVPLSRTAFRPDGSVKDADTLFPLPFEALDLDEAGLLAALGDPDDARALLAALTLVARGEHTSEALDRLTLACGSSNLPAALQFDWLRDHARRGLGAALGRRLQDALQRGETDSEALGAIAGHLERSPGCVPGAASALAALAETETPLATSAAQLLQQASLPAWHDTLDDWVFHESWMREPADDPEFGAALARFYQQRVERCAEDGRNLADLLAELSVRVQRHPEIGAAVAPALITLLARGPSVRVDILRLLGHLRCKDPHVRDVWLATVRGWSDFTETGLASFPCRTNLDEEELEALFGVLKQAQHVWPLKDRLAFAGLTHADRSPLVRWLIDHLGEEPARWSWLVSEDFRGLVDEPLALPEGLTEQRARALRVNRLALNCATRKDGGQSYAADEAALVAMLELDYPYGGAGGYNDYVQWGFWHAQSIGLHSEPMVRAALRCVTQGFPEGWSTHAEAAQAYLESAQLTLEQQVELWRAIPYQEPGERWRGVNIANTRFDGRGAGRVAVEAVPRMRRALYEGHVKAIEELARCTRLIDRDLDYLFAVLERGPAEARLWALGLVDEHAIDSLRVRAAVRSRSRDVDDEVARRAQALIAARGW